MDQGTDPPPYDAPDGGPLPLTHAPDGVKEEEVAVLTSMGFERSQVVLALRRSATLEQAANLLVSGDILDEAPPLPPPRSRHIGMGGSASDDETCSMAVRRHNRRDSSDSTTGQHSDDEGMPLLVHGPHPPPGRPSSPHTGSKRALDDMGIEMKDLTRGNRPPPYDDTIATDEDFADVGGVPADDAPEGGKAIDTEEDVRKEKMEEFLKIPEDGSPYRFTMAPVEELEQRMYKAQWSLPIRKYEELEMTFKGVKQLAEMPHFADDEACTRLLCGVLPHSLEKMLEANELHRWEAFVHVDLHGLLRLFINAAISLIQHDHRMMLEYLEKVFQQYTNYHIVNKSKPSIYNPESDDWPKDAEGRPLSSYTIAQPAAYKEYYFLKDFVNYFIHNGGMEAILKRFDHGADKQKLTGETLSIMLKPIGQFHKHLSDSGKLYFSPIRERTLKYIRALNLAELPSPEYEAVSDAMTTVKHLAVDASEIDGYRMDLALELLRGQTFNSKMNGLKEISRLTKEATRYPDGWLTSERVIDWMRESKVLQIALGSFLHLDGYVKRIEEMVTYMLRHNAVTEEDLMTIWMSQADAHDSAARSIRNLIKQLAWDLNNDQQTQLLQCFKRSWADAKGDEKAEAELLTFIKNLAKDGREAHLPNEVLKLLWDFIHDPVTPTATINIALDAFTAIVKAYYVGEGPDKKMWIEKFIEDIRVGRLVVPALSQIQKLFNLYPLYRNQYHTSVPRIKILAELDAKHSLISVVCTSAVRCCRDEDVNIDVSPSGEGTAAAAPAADTETPPAAAAAPGGETPPSRPTSPERLLEVATHSHDEILAEHLSLLKYLVKHLEGRLDKAQCYLLWDLVSSPTVPADAIVVLAWFQDIIDEHLDEETRSELFKERLLTFNPEVLTIEGFKCFRELFLTVNVAENNLEVARDKVQRVFNVDFVGADYLWSLALTNCIDNVAAAAGELLLATVGMVEQDDNAMYFVDACFKRMRSVTPSETIQRLDEEAPDTAIAAGVASAAANAGEASSAGSAELPALPAVGDASQHTMALRNVQRCIEVLDEYVKQQQKDNATSSRPEYIPHFLGGYGKSLTMRVKYDSFDEKKTFPLLTHTNAPLSEIRYRIGQQVDIDLTRHRLQIKYDGDDTSKLRGSTRLSELGISGNIQVNAAKFTRSYLNDEYEEEPEAIRDERAAKLPYVIMSQTADYMDHLFTLVECKDQKCREGAASLLERLPTYKSVWSTMSVNINSGLPFDRLPPFALGYWIEALSHRLMPAVNPMDRETVDLRASFVDSGGIQVLLGVLGSRTLRETAFQDARANCHTATVSLIQHLLTEALQFEPWNHEHKWSESHVDDFEFGLVHDDVMSLRQRSLLDTFEFPYEALKIASDPEARAERSARMAKAFDVTRFVHALLELFLDSAPPLGSPERSVSEDARAPPLARTVLELAGNLMGSLPGAFEAVVSFPRLSELVTSVIVGCPSQSIRIVASRFVLHIARSAPALELGEFPKDAPEWLVVTLGVLQSRLPFWGGVVQRQGASQRAPYVLEYFRLLGKFMTLLVEKRRTKELASGLGKVMDRMTSEVDWLVEFGETFDEVDYAEEPEYQNLLCGHMIYLRSLLHVAPECRAQLDLKFVDSITSLFLFRASVRLAELGDGAISPTKAAPFKSVCCTPASRAAAMRLLVDLCDPFVERLCESIAKCQHVAPPTSDKPGSQTWNYRPQTDPRSKCGYVGLKNAGATCYINSVMQQLYMNPAMRSAVLSLDEEERARRPTDVDDGAGGQAVAPKFSSFYEVQRMFSYLMLSDSQYFVPDGFWSS